LPRQAALVACLLFAAYVFVNAAWSVDPLAGSGKAALLTALILVTFATVKATEVLDKESLTRAATAFAAGALLGAVFILVELLTGGIVTRTLVGWIPSLSSPKHFRTENGVLVTIRLSKLDQNVNLALFHLWPGLLALMALVGSRRAIAAALLVTTIAAVVILSEHDSSQVALIVSGLAVLAALKWRAQVIRALAVLWCAAFVLVIPVSFLAYDSGLHLKDWLPQSARARVILWEYTAEETLERPLLGVGVDSTPRLREQQRAKFGRTTPEGFIYPRTMGHHAHNIYLQTWYELGVLGALLLAAAGVSVALLMLLLPAAAQPFAVGTFAAFAVVGAFAWGMWQSWFMCAVALLPIYVRVAAARADITATRC
jgi:O-antigen ligase